MTTMFGSARTCRRAARLGVSPPTACSWAAPEPIANDDDASRDADANLQGNASGGLQLRDRLDQGKPGMHGAFGVMLMGPRIAKIGEHPVAHIFGDETAGLHD